MEINFLSRKEDWKKFELNNKLIALNILYVPYNTEEVRHAYKSKHDLNRGNHVILLMIADGKKWHYLFVKKLSALLRGITSKHDHYCLNCHHSYRTKDVCNDHDYCYVEIPNEDNILKCKYREKSMKVPVIVYAESLLEKMSTYYNNPKKSSQLK